MYIPFSFTTSNQLITNGLVYWLGLDSYSGSIWYDKSENKNDALLSGSNLIISSSTPTPNNSGLYFNGTNNYLTFPSSLNNSPSGAFTIQWYAALSGDDNTYFVYGKDSQSDGWDILQQDTGTASDFIIRDVTGNDFRASIGAVVTMQLHTITVTEPVGGFSTATYYINTINNTMFPIVMKNGTDTNFPYNGFNASTKPLRFGFDTGIAGTFYKGPVSNLFLYNRVLSEAELNNNLLFLLESGFAKL